MSVDVLAVASGGGHWDQLMLLREGLAGEQVRYAGTDPEQARHYGVECSILHDCNQHQPLQQLRSLAQTFALVRRLRPRLVISTGAAPGLNCLLWGRLLGARTIWIDSLANAERLSLSGRLAKRIAHVVLTQHEQLAGDGVLYRGSVL